MWKPGHWQLGRTETPHHHLHKCLWSERAAPLVVVVVAVAVCLRCVVCSGYRVHDPQLFYDTHYRHVLTLGPHAPTMHRGRPRQSPDAGMAERQVCFCCAVGTSAESLGPSKQFVCRRGGNSKNNVSSNGHAMDNETGMGGNMIGSGMGPQPPRVVHARRWLGTPPPLSPGCRAVCRQSVRPGGKPSGWQ